MEDNKITESMLKRALKKKYEISSIGAIILFTILSVLFGITVYLLLELFFSIVKTVPIDARTNIINVISDVMQFKGFDIIVNIVLSVILVTIFIIIMNHNFILISKKRDMIQKFIIVMLVLTTVSVLFNLRNEKKEIHTIFFSIETLEYFDIFEFENNRESYDKYHENDSNKFSSISEIRDYYIQEYEIAVDNHMVKNNIKIILESYILIIITSIGVIFFYKKKE